MALQEEHWTSVEVYKLYKGWALCVLRTGLQDKVLLACDHWKASLVDLRFCALDSEFKILKVLVGISRLANRLRRSKL